MFHLFFTCMLQVFQAHVSSVLSVFFCMLQVLHMDVSKVDWDVAHVAMCRGVKTVTSIIVHRMSLSVDLR
jgi:hypothetical protein